MASKLLNETVVFWRAIPTPLDATTNNLSSRGIMYSD